MENPAALMRKSSPLMESHFAGLEWSLASMQHGEGGPQGPPSCAAVHRAKGDYCDGGGFHIVSRVAS